MNIKKANMISIFVLMMLCIFAFPFSSRGEEISINATEVTIYVLNSNYYENVTIPDGIPQSFQLVVENAEYVSYRLTKGGSVTVTPDGLIEPEYETWYHQGNAMSNNESWADGATKVEHRPFPGKSEITVTADGNKFVVNVNVIDYAVGYVDKVIDDYIAENINDEMTDTEKFEAICDFIAGYDYNAKYSSYVGMIASGEGGDCWACTYLAVEMCKRLGYDAWPRNGNKDLGAGSGHMNAIVSAGDIYYILEVGIQGTAPRNCFVTTKNTLFSYTHTEEYATVYQYDAKEEMTGTFVIPQEIDGYTVTKIDDLFSSASGLTEVLEIIIPDTVKIIGEDAFWDCQKITTIKLPSVLEELGTYAFAGCASLKEITIPASVSKMGDDPFFDCVSLMNVYVEEDNQTYKDINGLLYNKAGNKLLCYPRGRESLIIPEGTNEFGIGAFGYCTKIKSAVVPNTITTLPQYAFYHCSSLEEITIDSSVTSIDAGAFYECFDLKYVYYNGTKEQWDAINIGEHNTYLTDAIIHYNATGHTEVTSEDVAADCENEGSIGGSHCQVCKKTIDAPKIVPALGHTEVIDEAVELSCENNGLTQGSHCSVCGKILVAQIVTLTNGHTEVSGGGITPTCANTGLTKGVWCGTCGKTLVEQEIIPALGHTEVIDEAVAPTCTSTGLTKGSHCSVCRDIIEAQRVVDKIEHTLVIDEAVEPTCTETGLTQGSHCLVCGKTIVTQFKVGTVSHTEIIDEAIAPTCTSTGLTKGSHCAVCENVLVPQEIVEARHTTVIDEAVAPSCETTGLTQGSHCQLCGKILVAQEEVSAKGHTTIIDWAVAPDCETTGLTQGSHCSVCDKVITAQQEVPAVGHTEVIDKAVAADCETTGLTEGSHCKICKKVLISQNEIPSTGHKAVLDNAIAPGCETIGFTAGGHCEVCHKVLIEQEIIPALGHTVVVDNAQSPYCATDGLTEGSHCSVCKKVLVAQEIIKAPGHHVLIDKAVTPTCEESGKTEGSHCLKCGEVLVVQKILPPTGHIIEDDYEVEPTCTTIGLTQGSHCATCNKIIEEQRIISKKNIKGFTCEGKTSNSVTLVWEYEKEGCDGYEIWMYKASGWTKIATIDDKEAESYRVTKLGAGTNYKFKLRPYSMQGNSKVNGNYVSLTAKTRPTYVQKFGLDTRTTNSITLKWNKNTSADGYEIWMYKKNGWVKVTTIIDENVISYRVKGLGSSTNYKFKIRSYKWDNGVRLYSAGYSTSPSIKTLPSYTKGFSFSGRTSTYIVLKWTKNLSADGYVIEQYKGNRWVTIKTITSKTIVNYKVTGLKATTSYKFRIKAYKNDGTTKLYGAYASTTIKTR